MLFYKNQRSMQRYIFFMTSKQAKHEFETQYCRIVAAVQQCAGILACNDYVCGGDEVNALVRCMHWNIV